MIPHKIKVGSHWYVVTEPKHMQDIGNMGEVDYKAREIQVATHSNVRHKRFRKEDRQDTFWHELTHAILKDMGSKLESNESFVEAFSSRLSKAIRSARLK